MECVFFCIFMLNIICHVFSKNNTTKNCWEAHSMCITIDDLPLLMRNFMLCLNECEKLNNEECFNNITSQLKSSISVLRELYYHGQISFQVCIAYKVIIYIIIIILLCWHIFFLQNFSDCSISQ